MRKGNDAFPRDVNSRGPRSGSLRPLVPSIARTNNSSSAPNANSLPAEMYQLKIERISDQEAVDNGEDSFVNLGSEIIDEELRKPVYVTCSQTGRKMVRIQFDVQGFNSSDIRVKISDRKLIVFALHRENESGKKSTTEFCRRIKLPDDADADQLQCTFQNEVLTIEAPVVLEVEESAEEKIKLTSRDQPLNCPFLSKSDAGAMVQVLVEVGTLFKIDDVVVKLKGNNRRLVVLAERHEEEDNRATLSATLKREFELPGSINPASLRAGLTHNGILNVSALLVDQS